MKKKVLIISAEAWRDEDNGGNVLSNLFAPLLDEFEFAQIYCSPAMPNNKVCQKYFHLSEVDMLKCVLRLKKFGHAFYYNFVGDQSAEKTSSFTVAKRHRFEFLLMLRDWLWGVSRWRNKELRQFVEEFKPDLVFAPMYGAVYMHWINRYVFSIANTKVISYVSDDHLTLRQYSWSPFFWLNRFRLRKAVIKTAKYYSLLYTMTEEQKSEYTPILKIPMKILKKGGDFSIPCFENELHKPIRMIYGGNLSGNRAGILISIKKALENINKEGVVAQQVIYTQTYLTDSEKEELHDGSNSILMGKTSRDNLLKEYNNSDILLHVESFERRNRLLTRMSFSTKIIDLMQACRCIVAVCWKESSPYRYLDGNNIGYCIDSENAVEEKLRLLFSKPDLIQQYAKSAWEYGRIHHQTKHIQKGLRDVFNECIME